MKKLITLSILLLFFSVASAEETIISGASRGGGAFPTGCTANQVAVSDGSDDWNCDDQAGAAGGDSISIDSSAVVDPDFVSTGDIDFVDTTNTITANINANAVGNTEMADNAIGNAEMADDAIAAAEMADADHGAVSWTTSVATVETVTVTDNETTDETNAVVFTSGGDLDGDADMDLESDGDLTYNPNSGTLSATVVSGGTVTDGTLSINSGSVTGLVEGGLPDDSILEADLKAVDAAADEDLLTYESTTGDYEWESHAEAKAAMSLDNVENTALTTWTGNTAITSVGTIGTGTWQGDAVGGAYLGINGTTTETNIAADDLVIIYDTSATANRAMTRGNFVTGIGAGQAVIFDIGDDGGNDSTDVGEIATSGDTNSIFTEDAPDKILVDLSQNWPTADAATTATTASVATSVTITDNESTSETNAVIFTSGGDVDGGDIGLESDGDLTYNPSTGTLSSTAVTASGAVTGGTVTDGTVTLAGDGTITGLTAGGLPNDSVVSADIDDGTVTDADLNATLDISAKTVTFGLTSGDIPDISATYEPADAAIVKSDEAETLTANWVNTANPWAVNEGGTGAATFTAGGILSGNGTGAITAGIAGQTNEILVGGGTGFAPGWSTNIPSTVTIGSSQYIYRVSGTDVADADVVDTLTVTAQAGSTWNVADSVTVGSVYSGTTSLEEAVSASDSGASIIGVYDDFTNATTSTLQEVLKEFDTAISGGGTTLGDLTATAPILVDGGAATNDILPGIDADVVLSVSAAASDAAGVIEIATDAEAVTGTATDRAVTPANVVAILAAPSAIGGTTAAAGTFTTLSAGATGFGVDADGDVTAKSITVDATATPTAEFQDSDSLDADQTVATISAESTTVTAGAVVSDLVFSYKDGGDASGSFTEAARVDGSDNQFEFAINTTFQTGDIIAADLEADIIDETKLADNSLDSEHYNDGSIDVEHLATSAVRTATASKSAAYTIGTDDAKESYGGVIYVTSAAVITAPAVSAGMSFTVVTIGAIAVSLDVNASDRMYLDGTALADGDKATNTSTTGDMIHCAYESAAGWYCASGSPDGDHWTDTN